MKIAIKVVFHGKGFLHESMSARYHKQVITVPSRIRNYFPGKQCYHNTYWTARLSFSFTTMTFLPQSNKYLPVWQMKSTDNLLIITIRLLFKIMCLWPGLTKTTRVTARCFCTPGTYALSIRESASVPWGYPGIGIVYLLDGY